MIPDSQVVGLDGIAIAPTEGCVALQARHYSHPALKGRTVVRLVRENLSSAEDISLGVLGFVPTSSQPVGYVRNRAIGFPAWVIINDPANARHALNLVPDLRRAARMARSKPGNTKVLLDSLAKTLSDSAPHLLPTFLEEGARVFLAVGDRKNAAQLFSKAREAERVHNVPIDEERHRQVLLEFSFAGAINVRELSHESKALLERHSPGDALELFLKLNTDRIKGGLPPYANLAADLRRLIKATHATQLEVESRLLTDLLRSPALTRAPESFWKGYARTLKQLVRTDPAVRDVLLGLLPETVTSDTWVSFLKDVGITQDLRTGKVDAASWVECCAQRFRSSYWWTRDYDYPRKLSQLIRCLPGLRGRTITLDSPSGLEPELLDALLEAGAKVIFKYAKDQDKLEFRSWAHQADCPDLTFLADSEHAQLAAKGLGSVVNDGQLPLLVSHAGTRKLLGLWLEPRLPENPTPIQVAAELQRLAALLTSEGARHYPRQLETLVASLDAAKLLAIALRDGLITEYTWPVLEEAAREFGPDHELEVHESWPAMGVSGDGRVIWVEGDQRVADVTFTIPGGIYPERWEYMLVDGDTACLCRRLDGFLREELTWSSDPTTRHHASMMRRPSHRFRLSCPVPHGRLIADHLARAGDQTSPFQHMGRILSDGSSYWAVTDQGIFEIDPASGAKGRTSMPTALAEMITPHRRNGWTLHDKSLVWFPVGASNAQSPLSTMDGIHGWVVLELDDRTLHLGINGYSFEAPERLRIPYSGRCARPGGGHWLIGSEGELYRDSSQEQLLTLNDPAGRVHLLHRVPTQGWHQFRVRDEAASARLRTVTAGQVKELLEVLPGDDGSNHAASAQAAVEKLIGTSDAELANSVIWVASYIKRLVAGCLAAAASTRPDDEPDDEGQHFSSWRPSDSVMRWFAGDVRGTTDRPVVHALARRLSGEQTLVENVIMTLILPLIRPEVLLACAAAPLRGHDEIGGAAATVASVLDAGLYTPTGCVFSFRVSWNNNALRRHWRSEFSSDGHAQGPEELIDTPTGPGIAIGDCLAPDGDTQRMLVFSPGGGVPESVVGEVTTIEQRSAGLSPDGLVAAFEKLLADGPPPWNQDRANRLAEELGWPPAAAAILLAGLPNVHDSRKNFLPPPVRKLLGLKTTEAAEARDFLMTLGIPTLVGLLSAGATDPMRVATEGLDIDAMAAFWESRPEEETQAKLSGGLLAAADKEFRWRGAYQLRKLMDQYPDSDSLASWLWATTKVRRDDPQASWLADRYDAIRESFSRGTMDHSIIDFSGQVRSLLGLPHRTDGTPQEETSTVGAWTIVTKKNWDELSWDPGKVTDWEAEGKLVSSFPEELEAYDSLLRRVAVLSGEFDALQEDVRSGYAGWPQNPAVSAPEILAQVAGKLDLPGDSARYWLQLLAVHNPTDKNVDAWNGWEKTDRTRFAAPLLERGLIVEAMRSRAGRSYFLPGGWQEAASPHLPMEVWKAPFYDLLDGARVRPRLDIVVPYVPYRQLFTDAWQRYHDGDVPGYQELRTERYRRR